MSLEENYAAPDSPREEAERVSAEGTQNTEAGTESDVAENEDMANSQEADPSTGE